ncbi:hypothetical protein NPIL_32561, partial [Nephila pilipes]
MSVLFSSTRKDGSSFGGDIKQIKE